MADAWEQILNDFVNNVPQLSEFRMVDLTDLSVPRAPFPGNKLSLTDQRRIGDCLRRLGFENKNLMRDGVQQRTWVRK